MQMKARLTENVSQIIIMVKTIPSQAILIYILQLRQGMLVMLLELTASGGPKTTINRPKLIVPRSTNGHACRPCRQLHRIAWSGCTLVMYDALALKSFVLDPRLLAKGVCL